MKKLLKISLSLSVMMFFFILSTTVSAEEFKQTGIVTDTINLFSNSEKTQIENELSKKQNSYHILTVDQLYGESNLEELSDEVFEDWNLAKNDVLILFLIKDSNRQIFVSTFTNSSLNNSLQKIGYEDFIDEHFVPYAVGQGIPQGLLNLANEIEKIDTNENVVTTTSENNNQMVENNIQKESNSTSGMIILISFLIAIGVFIFSFGLVYLYQLSKKKKQKEEVLQQVISENDKLLHNVYELMESDLKSFSIYQGSTKIIFNEANDSLEEILTTTNKFKNTLSTIQIKLLKLNESDKEFEEITGIRSEIRKMNHIFDTCKANVKQLKEIDKNISNTIKKVREQYQQTKDKFNEITQRLSLPLNEINESIVSLNSIIDKADNLDEFDPIEAGKEMNAAINKLKSLSESLKTIEEQVKKYHSLSNRVSSTKTQLEQWIQKEKLLLVDTKPFSYFEEITKQQEMMDKHLRNGNTSNSERVLEQIEKMLMDAFNSIKELIDTRNKNQSNILYIEKELQKYSDEIEMQFRRTITNVNNRFMEKHWSETHTSFEAMKKKLQYVIESLPNIKTFNDESVQKYKEAENLISVALQKLKEAENLRNYCLNIDSNLETKLKTIINKFETLKREFNESLSKAKYNNISESLFNNQRKNSESAIQKLSQQITITPFDLDELTKKVHNIESEIHRLELAIEQAIKQKQTAERRLREIQSKYSNTYSRTRYKVSGSRYSSSYNQNMNQVDYLIANGLYLQAINELDSADRTIRQMESEYQSIVAEEQRQEAQRRAEEEASRRSSYNSYSNDDDSRRSSGGGYSWSDSGSSGSDSSSGGGSDF